VPQARSISETASCSTASLSPPQFGYDIGIWNDGAADGATNDVSHNTVRGFDDAFRGKVGRFNNPRS
jgi:hypothetical protein